MFNLLKSLLFPFGLPIMSFAGEGGMFGGSPVNIDLSTAGLMNRAREQGNLPPEGNEGEGGESGEGNNEGEGEGDEGIENEPQGNEGEGNEGEGGKEGNPDEFIYEPEGIKTPEDAANALKTKEGYIRDLETKNKRLIDALKPILKENEDGSYEVDTQKLSEVQGQNQNQPQPISESDKKMANDNFWKALENDALGTLMKVFDMAQTKSMAPYRNDLISRKTNEVVDRLHESQYKEYGDFRNDVKEIVSKKPELAAMGEEGIKLAYGQIFSKNLEQLVKQAFEDGKKAGVPAPNGASAPAGNNGQSASGGAQTALEKIRDAIHAQSDSGIPFLS
jgi:hypothetical protein